MHTICHPAERQGYRAVRAFHIVRQIGRNGTDGQQVFGGVGQKRFGADIGSDGEELEFLALGRFFVRGREVMGEGTVGGFFEFFVFDASLGICVWGIGSNFEHSESPSYEF
ncbi:hypothetical protein D3C76_852560 [compost metagenome]